jgi:hypothetical protein
VEDWNDGFEKEKKNQVTSRGLFSPLFHYSSIPTFQQIL